MIYNCYRFIENPKYALALSFVSCKKVIAVAKEAFKTFSKSTVHQCIDYLEKLKASIEKRQQEFTNVTIEEYGGTFQFSSLSNQYTGSWFDSMIEVIKTFDKFFNN